MIQVKAEGNLSIATREAEEGHEVGGVHTLTIDAEILPSTELSHEIVSALLDDQDKPKVSVEYTNVNNVIRARLVFSTRRNIVEIGQAGLDLKNEARDRGMTVEDLVAEKDARTAALVAQAKSGNKGTTGKGQHVAGTPAPTE